MNCLPNNVAKVCGFSLSYRTPTSAYRTWLAVYRRESWTRLSVIGGKKFVWPEPGLPVLCSGHGFTDLITPTPPSRGYRFFVISMWSLSHRTHLSLTYFCGSQKLLIRNPVTRKVNDRLVYIGLPTNTRQMQIATFPPSMLPTAAQLG